MKTIAKSYMTHETEFGYLYHIVCKCGQEFTAWTEREVKQNYVNHVCEVKNEH